MDLRNQLLTEHSKSNTLKILQWIGNNECRIEELIRLFLSDDRRVVQLASWLVSSLAEMHPALMEKHLHEMVICMIDDNQHIGVRRNMVRALQFIPISQTLQGPVLEACFSFLEDPKEGNVVQVFSMTVIERMTKEYPELTPEIRSIIERNLENDPSPAFRNRASKTLVRLEKVKLPFRLV